MKPYALVELGDPETIDSFLTDEEAQRGLEGCLAAAVVQPPAR
jgi:hypothetical protein